MALVLSKLFMRTISQNPNENQTGISLWTLDDIKAHQEKMKAIAAEQTVPRPVAAADDEADMDVDMDMGSDEDEYGDGGIPDEVMAAADISTGPGSLIHAR